MPISRRAELDDLIATGFNAGVDCSTLDSKRMWIVGTFVGTVQVEISPDDVAYIAEGVALTAPGDVALPADTRFARANCTAFTSGVIESQVTGLVTS